jgi:hypothetical protein
MFIFAFEHISHFAVIFEKIIVKNLNNIDVIKKNTFAIDVANLLNIITNE